MSCCYASVFRRIIPCLVWVLVVFFLVGELFLFYQDKHFDSSLCHSGQSYVLANSPHHPQWGSGHHVKKSPNTQKNNQPTKKQTTKHPLTPRQNPKQTNKPIPPKNLLVSAYKWVWNLLWLGGCLFLASSVTIFLTFIQLTHLLRTHEFLWTQSYICCFHIYFVSW